MTWINEVSNPSQSCDWAVMRSTANNSRQENMKHQLFEAHLIDI